MNSDTTRALFAVYVRGGTSAVNAATVYTWLVQPASQLLVLAQYSMRQHWVGLATLSTTDEPDYETLLAHLHGQLVYSQSSYSPKMWALPLRQQWAATGGRLPGSGWWWLMHSSAVSLTLATSYGQTRTAQLPDDSSVTLNEYSKLRYSAACIYLFTHPSLYESTYYALA